MKPIALLTDFGLADAFVGVMKAVLLSRAPGASLIDLTHGIPAGDVAAAAFRLWQAGPWLPDGTVVLAVVDPGVGGVRRALAFRGSRFTCVGPDNGIFSWLLAREPPVETVEIRAARPASSTFHGRDVFAPAAASLSAGAALQSLGAPVSDPIRLPFPALDVSAAGIRGEVLAIDRFGNLATSIGLLAEQEGGLLLNPWIPGRPTERLAGTSFRALLPGGTEVPLGRTFSDVPAGRAIAYIGSDGLLEIGVNQGRAADALGLSRGAGISLLFSEAGR